MDLSILDRIDFSFKQVTKYNENYLLWHDNFIRKIVHKSLLLVWILSIIFSSTFLANLPVL